MQVSQAAFTFIYRFMSNKSAENPEGVLNQETLKSFMSIQGDGDAAQWVQGHERFPGSITHQATTATQSNSEPADNWYKRNDADQYSIPYFETDILFIARKYPEILGIGCNQGAVNTFKTISPNSLTNGAATLSALTSNPICFGIQFLEAGAQSLLGISDAQESQLMKALSGASSAAKCGNNPIKTTSLTQLKNCPGMSYTPWRLEHSMPPRIPH